MTDVTVTVSDKKLPKDVVSEHVRSVRIFVGFTAEGATYGTRSDKTGNFSLRPNAASFSDILR